jgi:hypothetical protein
MGRVIVNGIEEAPAGQSMRPPARQTRKVHGLHEWQKILARAREHARVFKMVAESQEANDDGALRALAMTEEDLERAIFEWLDARLER